jgi:hypothetical protein
MKIRYYSGRYFKFLPKVAISWEKNPEKNVA